MQTEKDWFFGCLDEATVKAEYRNLVKRHHPDLGGDTATMQEINAAYEAKMRGIYARKDNATVESVKFWTERETEMMEVLAELLKVEGVEIEIIGVWLWITGDTRAAKDALKVHGCRWSADKLAWYWRSKAHKWHRKNGPKKDLNDLRSTWGSSGAFRGKRTAGTRREDNTAQPFRLTA